MLKKKSLLDRFKLEEKEINVKAWDDKVKIRKLTIAESTKVNAILSDGAEPKEDGKFFIPMDRLKRAQVATVAFALVEPKISAEELESLSDEAHEGVAEIYNQVITFDKPNEGK